jgi:hypothetical protein
MNKDEVEAIDFSTTDGINQFVEDIEARYQCKVLYITKVGSVLHGTSSTESDVDYSAIVMPSIRSLVLGHPFKTISVVTDTVDITLSPLENFLTNLTKMEANSVELLFSMFANHVVYQTPEVDILKQDCPGTITANVKRFTGFAMNMAFRYSQKGHRLQEVEELYDFLVDRSNQLSKSKRKTATIDSIGIEEFSVGKKYINIVELESPDGSVATYLKLINAHYILSSKINYVLSATKQLMQMFGTRSHEAKENKGVDRKAFSHALRAILQAKELISTGRLTFPVPEVDRIRGVKFGNHSNEELTNMIEEEFSLLDDVPVVIPTLPNLNAFDRIKLRLYGMD